MRARAHAIVLAVFVSACATVPPADLPRLPREPIDLCMGGGARDTVELAYLGAGGFAIRAGDEAILTAPFFSNPGFLRVGLGFPIAPDLGRIPERPCLLEGARVSALLVGHAHYDHLMDVPAVLRKWGLADPVVYGSLTAANLLAAASLDVTTVDADAGDRSQRGRWLEPSGSRFRVMALRSEHAPHAPGIRLFQGRVDAPLRETPRSAYGWKEGQTYAYLVDVLANDGQTVLMRIHYQDAASNPEIGWPPADVLAERKVDLVIFCAASFELVTEHPEAILRTLDPRYALAAHWENFFSAPSPTPGVVPLTDLPELLSRLRTVRGPDGFGVPRPGDRLRFNVCPPRP
jgi:hypothetical protein